jgi:hypothetical protein
MNNRDLVLVLGSVLVIVAVLIMLNVIQLPSSVTQKETTYVTTNRPWFGPPYGPPYRVRPGIGPWPHGPHNHHRPHPPHGHSIPTHLIVK